MKKILLVAAFTVAGFIGANAQPAEGFNFGAGPRIGLPIGDFGDYWSFALGADLQGEYGFSDMVAAVISTGYTRFFGKDNIDGLGLIPILAGARVYPSPNFFIGGQVGYGILTGGGESEGSFNYQPHIGYNAERFQVALNFNGLTINEFNYNHIALTAIIKFGGAQ